MEQAEGDGAHADGIGPCVCHRTRSDFIFFKLAQRGRVKPQLVFQLSNKREQMNWISEQFGVLKGNKTWHYDATMWPYDAS